MVHLGLQIEKIAKNSQRFAHSQWGPLGYISDLDRGMILSWNRLLCVQQTFLASTKSPGIWEWCGR